MNTRTTLRFSSAVDVWPVVQTWAAEQGYKLKGSAGNECTFQKGVGFLVAPAMLRVKQEGGVIDLEAWIRINLLARAGSVFILPAETGIGSGGFRAVVPRRFARTAVNELLARLGQPPIP
jgi:hypothetical protein